MGTLQTAVCDDGVHRDSCNLQGRSQTVTASTAVRQTRKFLRRKDGAARGPARYQRAQAKNPATRAYMVHYGVRRTPYGGDCTGVQLPVTEHSRLPSFHCGPEQVVSTAAESSAHVARGFPLRPETMFSVMMVMVPPTALRPRQMARKRWLSSNSLLQNERARRVGARGCIACRPSPSRDLLEHWRESPSHHLCIRCCCYRGARPRTREVHVDGSVVSMASLRMPWLHPVFKPPTPYMITRLQHTDRLPSRRDTTW